MFGFLREQGRKNHPLQNLFKKALLQVCICRLSAEIPVLLAYFTLDKLFFCSNNWGNWKQ